MNRGWHLKGLPLEKYPTFLLQIAQNFVISITNMHVLDLVSIRKIGQNMNDQKGLIFQEAVPSSCEKNLFFSKRNDISR